MSENRIVIYGDTAEVFMEDALYFMKLRTGWEFPEPIAELLIDLARNIGFDISNGIGCVDDIYVNGEWGEIEDLYYLNDEEDKELFLRDCFWYNDTYYVKHF